MHLFFYGFLISFSYSLRYIQITHWDNYTKTPLFLDQKMYICNACIIEIRQWDIEKLRRLFLWYKKLCLRIHYSDIQIIYTKTPALYLDKKCVHICVCGYIIQIRHWDTKTPLYLDKKMCAYAVILYK